MEEASPQSAWNIEPIIFCVLFGMCGVMNFLVLTAVINMRFHRSADFLPLQICDYIILNMCVADCWTGLGCVIITIATGANLLISPSACILSFWVTYSPEIVSVLHLALLGFTRWKMATSSWSGDLKEHIVRWTSRGIWSFSILTGTAMTLFGNFELAPSGLYCGTFNPRRADAIILGTIVLATAFGSMGINLWCYRKVLRTGRKMLVDGAAVDRLAKMCYVLTLIYIFTLTPYGVMITFSLLAGKAPLKLFDYTAILCLAINYCANPIVYVIYCKRFRKALLSLPGLSYLSVRSTVSPSNDPGDSTIERRRSSTFELERGNQRRRSSADQDEKYSDRRRSSTHERDVEYR